jgi:hypothetical protein
MIMMKMLTLMTEDIFAILGFALYAGLVYYMIRKGFRKYFGKDRPKTDSRKNFSRDFSAAQTFHDKE